jgi:hypothetical protein
MLEKDGEISGANRVRSEAVLPRIKEHGIPYIQ